MQSRPIFVAATASLALLAASATAARGVHDFVGREQRLQAAKVAKVHVPQDKEEESVFALEGTRNWGAAANAWKKRYEELGRVRGHPALRQAHQKALFRYVLCMHRYAVEKLKPQITKRAASIIVQLEKGDEEMGGLKKQYRELLKNEPALMAAYGELRQRTSD
jgi:hypothetical protein